MEPLENRTVGSSKGVTWRDLPCRSLLNRCDSERLPFAWTINPYRGCEFGCRYCYARYTHEYMGLEDARLFETEIFAKLDAPRALEGELRRGVGSAGGIALGTATDPYQPAEKKLLITRRLLEVFARARTPRRLRISLTTKSDLVLRDLDLLREVAGRHDLAVNVTITTLNRRLARLLEPRAPRPAKRLLAVRELSGAGLTTGVFIMPVLPGLNDAPASLEALVAAASRAGASYLAHQVLFLRSGAKQVFLRFLRESYPRLSPHYRRTYGGSAYHTLEYRARIDNLVRASRQRHGLGSRPAAHDAEDVRPAGEAPDPAAGRQLTLVF